MASAATTGTPPQAGTSAEEDFKLFLQEFKKAASLSKKQTQAFQNTTLEDVKNVIASIEQK
ncbi:hypothetical protein QQZ08_001840 [Neonectria magnoliae]|uniref:Uncharacterized protein n=1 Tax=Neonectria magnoliae TaxID=2732573 RepID=A0ABR1IDD2_9HYPO